MKFFLIKSRPQRMQQANKLVLCLLHRILPHQLLMLLNLRCLCRLQHLLVPLDPPSFNSSFVIFAQTHKLVFVQVHSSLMANTLQGLECFCSSYSLYCMSDCHALPHTSFRCQHIFYVTRCKKQFDHQQNVDKKIHIKHNDIKIVVLLLFFICCSQTDVDISVLRNIQVDKIRFNTSRTSVTDSIVSEVRQTLFILCITYLHLVAYFYRL